MSTKGIAARLRGNKPSTPKSSSVYTTTKKEPTAPVVPTENQFPCLAGVQVPVPVPVPAQVPVPTPTPISTVPVTPAPTRGAWANGIDSIRKAALLPPPPPPVKRAAPVAHAAPIMDDDLEMSESEDDDYDALW